MCKLMVCYLCCELLWFLFREVESMVFGLKGYNSELCKVSCWKLGLDMLGKDHKMYIVRKWMNALLEEIFFQVDQPLMSP